MRFLYRIWKFSEQMQWCKIADKIIESVNGFKANFEALKTNHGIINNVSSTEAELSSSTKHKDEHYMENAFTHEDKAKKF